MKHIYLHIGRAKTGTTAIQGFLAHKRQELLDKGVHYVTADGRDLDAGHQRFAKSFIKNPPGYMIPVAQPDRIRQAIREEICDSPCETILLSSENFPLAEVDAVAAYFDALPTATSVKIISFARSQDELAESEYNQMVKLKRETRPFQEYADRIFEGADFLVETEKWEREFGRDNIICRIYDTARGNVIEQFLSCLPGLSPELADGFAQGQQNYANQSIGAKALCAVRLLNTIEIEKRNVLYRRLFEEFAKSDLPAVLFDVEDARQFRARFAQSNARFTERYIGTPVEDLGGRRYSDDEREALRGRVRALGLGV